MVISNLKEKNLELQIKYNLGMSTLTKLAKKDSLVSTHIRVKFFFKCDFFMIFDDF